MWDILENLFPRGKPIATRMKKLRHWNERISNLLAIQTQYRKDTQHTKGFKLITLEKLFQMSYLRLLHEHLKKGKNVPLAQWRVYLDKF